MKSARTIIVVLFATRYYYTSDHNIIMPSASALSRLLWLARHTDTMLISRRNVVDASYCSSVRLRSARGDNTYELRRWEVLIWFEFSLFSEKDRGRVFAIFMYPRKVRRIRNASISNTIVREIEKVSRRCEKRQNINTEWLLRPSNETFYRRTYFFPF